MFNGFVFNKAVKKLNVDVAAVVGRDPEIGVKSQNLVNALFLDGQLFSFAGVTGLIFGESATDNIITFSKVAVNMDQKTINSAAALLGASGSAPKLVSGLIKINSVDFSIVSGNDISIKSLIIQLLGYLASFGS